MSQSKYDYLRQFISNYIQGANVDAILGTLADETQKLEDLSIAVTDQLTISTASGEYLTRLAAEIGIVSPADLGMSDDSFRDLVIKINAEKQTSESIHLILNTFYGDEATHAWIQTTIPEPYVLSDSMSISMQFETDEVITVSVLESDFRNISQATAQELSDVLTRGIRNKGINAFAQAYENFDTGQKFVRIFGAAKGPISSVRVLGGEIQSVVKFPKFRKTDQVFSPVNYTVWEIKRTEGSTVRFRWFDGNVAPLINQVQIGDRVLLYGEQIKNIGLSGTYAIKQTRPSALSPATNSGYFEVDMPFISDPNYIAYITQLNTSDIQFFVANRSTPLANKRYALAFEPDQNKIKIYMPATTKIISRDLTSGMHLHYLHKNGSLNGTYGHATDPTKQIRIVNDTTIKVPSSGLDNYGTKGLLNSTPIKYVNKSNGEVTVVCEEPHQLSGNSRWLDTSSYTVGQKVTSEGTEWECTANNGILYGGARTPMYGSSYWKPIGTAIDRSNLIVSVSGVEAPYDKEAYLGDYMIDPSFDYTLTNNKVTLLEDILAGESKRVLSVLGTVNSKNGMVLMDLAKDNQESGVPYLSAQTQTEPDLVPIIEISQVGFNITVQTQSAHNLLLGSKVAISGTANFNGTYTVSGISSPTIYTVSAGFSAVLTEMVGYSVPVVEDLVTVLSLDPSYIFKKNHKKGTDVTVISDSRAYTPDVTGADYSPYVTGTAEARQFGSDLIRTIAAMGINIEIVIVYPDDVGLGKSGTEQSDKLWVWGRFSA